MSRDTRPAAMAGPVPRRSRSFGGVEKPGVPTQDEATAAQFRELIYGIDMGVRDPFGNAIRFLQPAKVAQQVPS